MLGIAIPTCPFLCVLPYTNVFVRRCICDYGHECMNTGGKPFVPPNCSPVLIPYIGYNIHI